MSAFFRRTKSLVGFDIGSSAVKAVELRQTASGYKVAAIGSAPVPPASIVDGAIEDVNAVADVIRQVFEKNNFKATEVVGSLSGNAVIVKKIVLPKMTEEELAEAIYWEAEQYIPFDIQDVNLDYQMLKAGPGDADGDTMGVLLVAAKKKKIADYTGVISQAGRVPVVVDVDAFALQNAYEVNYGPTPLGSLTIVDAAASTPSDGATITSCMWNFGDTTGTGTCSVPAAGGDDPACVAATPWLLSHSYAASASYTITLTVTDSLGQTAVTTQTLVVSAVADPTAVSRFRQTRQPPRPP